MHAGGAAAAGTLRDVVAGLARRDDLPMKLELAGYVLAGTATFVATVLLWGDHPPAVGQHLLPISGICWMAALARSLAPNRRLVTGCVLAYLVLVAPALYAGAVAHGTHVIYASLGYFAITAAGAALLVHASRLAAPVQRGALGWRIVTLLLLVLTVDTLRYAIVLLARWLAGAR
jgi:hypothetical protein